MPFDVTEEMVYSVRMTAEINDWRYCAEKQVASPFVRVFLTYISKEGRKKQNR
jgi:hypothetical protein